MIEKGTKSKAKKIKSINPTKPWKMAGLIESERDLLKLEFGYIYDEIANIRKTLESFFTMKE